MKQVCASVYEEYYNPEWFFDIDQDYYQDICNEHRNELIDLIENKDHNGFIKFCETHGYFLPFDNYVGYDLLEYTIEFNDNMVHISVYVSGNGVGGGSMDLVIVDC